MFGRGEKYVLPVMNLYPKEVTAEVDECLNGTRPSYITRAAVETIGAISIDKVTMRKNPSTGEVYYRLDHTATGEYIRSWTKGLGRLVSRDFRKKDNDNKDKYALVRYTSSASKTKRVALVRFIMKDEIPEEELEDWRAYGAITGELTSWVEVTDPTAKGNNKTYSIEDDNYYCVLKVVPYVASMKPEEVIEYPRLIAKKNDGDANWLIETDPFEDDNSPSPTVHKVDEEPETDFMNPPEDELF